MKKEDEMQIEFIQCTLEQYDHRDELELKELTSDDVLIRICN